MKLSLGWPLYASARSSPRSRRSQLQRYGAVRGTWAAGRGPISFCRQRTDYHAFPTTQVTIIFDLEGLSMKHFYRPFVSAYMDLCELFETLFPECLSKVRARTVGAVLIAVRGWSPASCKQYFLTLVCPTFEADHSQRAADLPDGICHYQAAAQRDDAGQIYFWQWVS